jgi:hypothetical protein
VAVAAVVSAAAAAVAAAAAPTCITVRRCNAMAAIHRPLLPLVVVLPLLLLLLPVVVLLPLLRY